MSECYECGETFKGFGDCEKCGSESVGIVDYEGEEDFDVDETDFALED